MLAVNADSALNPNAYYEIDIGVTGVITLIQDTIVLTANQTVITGGAVASGQPLEVQIELQNPLGRIHAGMYEAFS